jgi:hypothetical protein
MNIHCSACGAPLPTGAKFCPACALALTAIAMPTPAPSRLRSSLLVICVAASLVSCMVVETQLVFGQGRKQTATSQPFGLKGDMLGETLTEFRAAHDHLIHTRPGEVLASTRHLPECTNDKVAGEYSFLSYDVEATSETEEELRAGVVKCIAELGWQDRMGYDETPTVAGITAFRTVYYFFREQLYKIDSELPRPDFGNLREAFIAKYGPPFATEIAHYQNGFGARFSGQRLFWRNSVSTIAIGELDGEDNTVQLVFRDKVIGKECETAGRVKDRGKDM